MADVYHLNDDNDSYEIRSKENFQAIDESNDTLISKQYDNYNFLLSEKDFYPPEDKRYLTDKKGVLGSKFMYVQYLSEFYDYYKECFEDMFEE